MLKNLLALKKELTNNRDHIDKKRKKIQTRKESLREEMDKWGRTSKSKRNLP